MKEVQGDLIRLSVEGNFDVIAQGCNCMCTMGKGLALSIRKAFPEAYAVDQKTKKGDVSKLGTCTIAQIALSSGNKLDVINCYTQYDYRGSGPKINYEALEACMMFIRDTYPKTTRFGFSCIGAGLAGGDWDYINNTIQTIFEGYDVTIVKYSP